MDNTELSAMIAQEQRYVLGGTSSRTNNSSELVKSWKKSLDYYYGKPRGDEVQGRSRVISMDVADMVEQTLAQIIPAFDKVDLCTFEGPDSRQMQIESDAVNYTVLQQNPGFVLFTEAIKDALLQRNGIIKVLVEETIEIQYAEHEGVPEMLLPQVLGNTGEVVEHDIVDEGSPGFIDEYGQEFPGTPAIFNVKVKHQVPKKELKLCCVPPEEFSVSQEHNSIFLQDARFVMHSRIMTQSDLIAQGFDPEIVANLKTYTVRTEEEERARSRDQGENEYHTADDSNRNIKVDECYYLVDFDGDGIAERRKILYSGGTILENEWYPCVPFASGTPYIMPHRFWGLSFYDKLRQTQDIKTAFLRKTIDNAEGLINQRVIARAKDVNMDDLLTSRPNGVVRAKNVDSVVPFPVQNLGDTGLNMLGYMDKVRKEAAGAQLDIGTQEDLPVAGQTAHGVERWMTSKEHLSHMIAKTLAETLVKGTYLITHKLMKAYMPEPMQYQVNGNYNETSPGTWQYGDKPHIEIDTSMAEKQKEYAALGAILEQQLKSMEGGSNLTTPQHVFNTLVRQANIAGLSSPSDFWLDPMSEQGRQLAQQTQQAKEQAKAEQVAENDKLYQTQLEISRMQETSDHMKAQLDFMIKENEQLRKWVEMELEQKYNVPGQGLQSVKQ